MKKILIIDDEESVRSNIKLILQREGYNALIAKNGIEGIETAKKECPHLIICDVLMPVFDGYQVLKALRSYKPTTFVPFIFLTGKSDQDDFRTGMLLGGDDYLTKPFKITELIQTVKIQLEKYENFLKEAEELKWESEESFKAIFNYAPVGIALINPEGRILKVNQAYCGILGYSKEELYDLYVNDITYSDDLNYTIMMNEKVKWGELRHYTTEKRYICKGGKTAWVNISVSGVYKKNGALSFYISNLQDISERKSSEIESLKSERLQTIGKMAAMLTHEIKTPLTSIRMNVELLTSGALLTENNKKSLNIIKKETKRLTNLVKDVLQFSNQMDLVNNEFLLNRFFENLIYSFEPIVRPLNIKITANVDEIKFVGDQEKLLSAFSTIVHNSIEAITENGEIEITARDVVEENEIRIYLKDNGCGIKEKTKIFEPFYTSKVSGTGLGLVIAQKIFQQHSGNITLKSSVPGETIFEIIFSKKG